jgi:hypothetical protein
VDAFVVAGAVLCLAACGASGGATRPSSSAATPQSLVHPGGGRQVGQDIPRLGPTAPDTSAPLASHPAAATAPDTSSPVGQNGVPGGTAAPLPPCTSDIRVIPSQLDHLGQSEGVLLIFNNVSTTTTCDISGYPSIDLEDDSGTVVAHLAPTLSGSFGGIPNGVSATQPVILAPGQSASATAQGNAIAADGSQCGEYELSITVPNQSEAVGGGNTTLPKCNAIVTPIVAGTTGQAS